MRDADGAAVALGVAVDMGGADMTLSESALSELCGHLVHLRNEMEGALATVQYAEFASGDELEEALAAAGRLDRVLEAWVTVLRYGGGHEPTRTSTDGHGRTRGGGGTTGSVQGARWERVPLPSEYKPELHGPRFYGRGNKEGERSE